MFRKWCGFTRITIFEDDLGPCGQSRPRSSSSGTLDPEQYACALRRRAAPCPMAAPGGRQHGPRHTAPQTCSPYTRTHARTHARTAREHTHVGHGRFFNRHSHGTRLAVNQGDEHGRPKVAHSPPCRLASYQHLNARRRTREGSDVIRGDPSCHGRGGLRIALRRRLVAIPHLLEAVERLDGLSEAG